MNRPTHPSHSTRKLARGLALLATLALGSLHASDIPSPMGVRQLLDTGASLIGETVAVDGFVTGVCKHSGCKAFLHDRDSSIEGTLRVERTGDMPAFTQDLAGRTVRVRGTIRELRIDTAYLDTWQAKIESAAAQHDEEDKDCADAGCTNALATQAALKKIAELRAQVAATPAGYISSLWLDGLSREDIEPAR